MSERMTFETLAGYLTQRWGKSQRISIRGRAIVIGKVELEMIVAALLGAGALRRLGDLPPAHTIKWSRVNDEPFEYAIQKGTHGDEFVKRPDGTCLRRGISISSGG